MTRVPTRNKRKEKVMNDNKKTEETTVQIVQKDGVFTRIGKVLDKNTKKIVIGAVTIVTIVGMIIFVPKNNRDGDETFDDNGFADSDDIAVDNID